MTWFKACNQDDTYIAYTPHDHMLGIVMHKVLMGLLRRQQQYSSWIQFSGCTKQYRGTATIIMILFPHCTKRQMRAAI